MLPPLAPHNSQPHKALSSHREPTPVLTLPPLPPRFPHAAMPHQTASAATPPQPPLSHYREAVQQYFDCAPSEFELAAWEGQGPCYIRMGEEVYRFDSTHDLTERAKLLLTDWASMFPPDWASELLADVHRQEDFYPILRQQFATDAVRLQQLQTVMARTQRAGNDNDAFWDAVYATDCQHLYPAAIVAASQTYNTARLLAAVVNYLLSDEDEYLGVLQGRLLGNLVLNEAPAANPSAEELAQEEYFYVYAVDPYCWEESLVVHF